MISNIKGIDTLTISVGNQKVAEIKANSLKHKEGMVFEMNELTLKGLINQYKSYFGQNEAVYLILQISINGAHSEYIVVQKVNFESKIEYLKQVYNNDLSLKANPTIKIENYYFLDQEEMKNFDF